VPCAEELTAQWLTDVMSPLLGGTRVLGVECTPVGTGQMSDTVRLTPTYDGATDAPRSLIAKLPAADMTSRATAGALRSYEIEVNFYRQLAPQLPVSAPLCYHADVDATATDFVLLLEDVAPARPGDQLAGCNIEQAALAVEELPRLHAPLWGDVGLAKLDWLHRDPEQAAIFTSQLVAGLFVGFRDRYADRLDDDIVTLGERLMGRLPTYFRDRPEPWTVVHGDFRLDNLLFGSETGGPLVTVVDWQTAAHGPGIADLSYFVGAGLLTEARRQHERDLVRSYHDALCATGVENLDWDECWTQYRRYSFAGLIMAIAASMLVEQTERGDDMFVTMAQRHGRHAIDLEAERLVA
jgi:hypothetical protein